MGYMKRSSNYYRPVPKKYSKRLTLYGKIQRALESGDVKDYDIILEPLEHCKDNSELKEIITNLIRDYLLVAKRDMYQTNRDKFNNLFKN